MDYFVVDGGKRLNGTAHIGAAKNSVLPLLAASLIVEGETTLLNCPLISDVYNACGILRSLGSEVRIDGNSITVRGGCAESAVIKKDMMSSMRGSLMFLGPMLAKIRHVSAFLPGGCRIGSRPIDIHLDVFGAFGATVLIDGDNIELDAPHGIKAADVKLRYCSVGATENAILTAVCLSGRSVIRNTAREPEIVDLADYLIKCGARIKGAGSSIVTVDGGYPLSGVVYTPRPDRIAAATYAAAAAVTGGHVMLKNAIYADMRQFLNLCADMGCTVKQAGGGVTVSGPAARLCFPANTVIARPFPGFPTDCAPIAAAMLCTAAGSGILTDDVFENRFCCCAELCKFGADVVVCGSSAAISGVNKLSGADVAAADLRGGAALILAAFAANGRSTISNAGYVDRGYEAIEKVLASLGACISRCSDGKKEK